MRLNSYFRVCACLCVCVSVRAGALVCTCAQVFRRLSVSPPLNCRLPTWSKSLPGVVFDAFARVRTRLFRLVRLFSSVVCPPRHPVIAVLHMPRARPASGRVSCRCSQCFALPIAFWNLSRFALLRHECLVDVKKAEAEHWALQLRLFRRAITLPLSPALSISCVCAFSLLSICSLPDQLFELTVALLGCCACSRFLQQRLWRFDCDDEPSQKHVRRNTKWNNARCTPLSSMR